MVLTGLKISFIIDRNICQRGGEMKILKDLLKEQRRKANLTRKELADKINITPDGYSKIERGDKNPSLKTFSE